MSIKDETKLAEKKFFTLLEEHEQKVLELVSKVDKSDTHQLECEGCKVLVEVPIYISYIRCKKCTPKITLSIDHLEDLLHAERERFFQQVSEIDEEFSAQEAIKLRDSVLKELQKEHLIVEASVAASEMMIPGESPEDEEEFESNEFDILVKNLLRLRAAERLSRVFDLGSEVTKEILKTKVETLFGRKPPKSIGVKKG